MRLPRVLHRWFALARKAVWWAGASGLPFTWPAAGSTPAMRARRRGARRAVFFGWPLLLRPLPFAGMLILWPIRTWREAGEAVAGDADPPDPVTNDSARTRRWRVWRIAMRHNFHPHDVLMWRMDRSDGPIPDDNWVPARECIWLMRRLQPQSAKALAGDKAAFAAFCLKHGLRQPLWLGHWRGGQTVMAMPGPLPDAIVVKPTSFNNAQGQELWTREGAEFVRADRRLSESDLLDHIARKSQRDGAVIAQACLVQHPDLSARGVTGSPAARLLTAQVPDGAPFVVDAYFSTPPTGKFASNDGIGAYHGVDVATGRLTPSACTYVPAWTGQPLVGMTLPGWADAVAQALRGHAAFPEPAPLLAWDIGFTPDGPALIEVNTGVDQTYEQAIRAAPAYAGPLGPVIDAWLSHRGL